MVKKIIIFIIVQLLLNSNKILAITKQEANNIGLLIWQNEASRRIDLLTFWSQHESFPSLGIGHFIWHPQGKQSKYIEQFPLLCAYLKTKGVALPNWLEKAMHTGAPWASREEFLEDKEKINDLRNLLSCTIDLQTNFIIEQFEKQLPKIITAAPEGQKDKIIYNTNLMRETPIGTYALVDYLNFKGSGLVASEEKMGQRWGLLQVLFDMPNNLNISNAHKAFAISAAKMLLRLIQNSAPDYGPIRYLSGWFKRISTYTDPDIFKNIEA